MAHMVKKKKIEATQIYNNATYTHTIKILFSLFDYKVNYPLFSPIIWAFFIPSFV